MQKKEYLKIVFILGLLTAIGPFSIDMYLPGFAGIAKDLHTTIADVSMTLSSYFIGISAGNCCMVRYWIASAEGSHYFLECSFIF